MQKTTEPCLITLVHLGDSITFGQCLDPALRWTTLIERRLDEVYRDSPVLIHSINRGISGETTRMALERFPADVQNAYPDIVTIQYGLNDCNCWLTDRGLPRVSSAAFHANLVEMIMRAQRFGAKRIILANNHPTLRHKAMLSGERYEDANARYCEITRQVATETGVILCDVRGAFAVYPPRQLESLLMPYPDQLHLSAEGNGVYADVIWPLVRDASEAVLRMKIESGED